MIACNYRNRHHQSFLFSVFSGSNIVFNLLYFLINQARVATVKLTEFDLLTDVNEC
jgi:hypothetical protein